MPAFAVSTFTAARNDDASVTLTWADGEEGTNLAVQRTQSKDVDYTDIAQVPQIDGAYTDKTADSDKTYYYRLHYGAGMFTDDVSVSPVGGTLSDESKKESQGGLFERAIAGVVNGLCLLFESATGATGFKKLNEVIFPAEEFSMDLEKPAPFAQEWGKLDKMYLAFSLGTLPLCLIVIFITAFRFIGAGAKGNPQSRMEAQETIWRWFFAILIIASAPLFVRVLFVLDNALVEAFRSATMSMGVKEFEMLNGNNAIVDGETGTILGDALVKLYMLAMEFWINIIFFVRDWVLRVFYIFTPVMAWLWAINKNINAASVWAGEILTNAFLHAAYALVFCVIVVFIQGANEIPWPAKVIGVASLIALAGAIRNTLQGLWTRLAGVDEEGIGAKALGMLGAGGLAGVSRVAAISAAKPGSAGGLRGSDGTYTGGAPSGGSPEGSPFHGREAEPGELFPSMRGQPPHIGGGLGNAELTKQPSSPTSQPPPAGGVSGGGGTRTGGTSFGRSVNAPAGPASLPQAMAAGRATQGVFQAAATVTSAPFNVIPGGQHVQKVMVGAAGAAGRAVGGGASIIAQSIQSKGGLGHTLKEMTGEKSIWKAGFKTAGAMAAETLTPGMTEHVLPRVAAQQSLDGYRFR